MPSPRHIPHYTYLDYEKWSDNWELIDGIPFSRNMSDDNMEGLPKGMSPMPSIQHQEWNFELVRVFKDAVLKSNCEKVAVYLPVNLRLSEDTVVHPDMTVICEGEAGNLYLSGVPSLVAEILSPSTMLHDKNVKFSLYQDYKIKYYLVVDVFNKVCELFELDADGLYQLIFKGGTFERELQFCQECKVNIKFQL